MMHFVVEAKPKENYVLELRFRTGEVRLLDMKPYIQQGGVFGRLREEGKFREVEVQGDLGGLVWPSGADFCPNTAFAESEPYPARVCPRRQKDEPRTAARVRCLPIMFRLPMPKKGAPSGAPDFLFAMRSMSWPGVRLPVRST